jgi:hypothetical protein
VVDESVKFAWAYLLTYGKLTSGEWSFYGGGWEDIYRKLYVESSVVQAELEQIKKKAVSVGIDWGRTDIPSVSDKYTFNGTFASHHDKCLATLGKLVLKNGEEFLIGSADDDAAHLAETAREMLKGKDSAVQNLANKL